MRAYIFSFVIVLSTSVFGAEPDTARIKDRFKSDNYTIAWKAPRKFDTGAELEIGDGFGHGFTLGWLRFRPEKDRVAVLSLKLDEGWHTYKSKWPPDRAPVTVKIARMEPDAYTALLHDLAFVVAAELHPVERDSITVSSEDFWVFARGLATKKETLFNLDWAGYRGDRDEADFAKPETAVALARAAVKGAQLQGPRSDQGRKGLV